MNDHKMWTDAYHDDSWLTWQSDSAANKRNFLLQHGTSEHIRKIADAAGGDQLKSEARLNLAMEHNPQFDMWEEAWKHPYLREKVAAHPRVPVEFHEMALKFDNPGVRFNALMNPRTTRSQAEHMAKHDRDTGLRDKAQRRIANANAHEYGGTPFAPERDEIPPLSESKKSYINFSREIGILETTTNPAQNAAILAYHGTKSDFDTFKTPAWFTPSKAMAHGFAGDLGDGIRNEHSKIYTVRLHLNNPVKTDDWDVTEGKAYDPKWRSAMIAKGHDGIHFEREGETEYVAFHPHQIEILGKESAASQTLEENSDNFLGRYGTPDEIERVIHNVGDYNSGEFEAVRKNPLFTRAHHEMLMNHPNPDARFVACLTPHTTTADLHKLIVDQDRGVRENASRGLSLRTHEDVAHKFDDDGRIKPEHSAWLHVDGGSIFDESRKDNFMVRMGTEDDITHAIQDSAKKEYAGHRYQFDERIFDHAKKNPMFTRAHQEMLLTHPHPEAKIIATINRHTTNADLEFLKKDEDEDVRIQATRMRQWRDHPQTRHKFDDEGRILPQWQYFHHDDNASIMESFEALMESIKKDRFMARMGTVDNIERVITTGNTDEVSRVVSNPLFTREHMEKLRQHPDGGMRFYVLLSRHCTKTDALDMAMHDHSNHVRWAAENRIRKFEADEKTGSLYESKESFMARFGSAEHITHAIKSAIGVQYDEGDDTYMNATKNPHFSREHQEMLLNHTDPSARWVATTNIHTTNKDLEQLAGDANEEVRSQVKYQLLLRKRIRPADFDVHGRLKPQFHHELLHPEEDDDLYEQAPEHHRAKRFPHHNHPQKKKKKDKITLNVQHPTGATSRIVAESEKRTYKDFSIFAGIRAPEPVEEPVSPMFKTYGWGGVRVYVPLEDITSTAKETREGMDGGGSEPVVEAWLATHDLAKHLELSDGVHEHYAEAGVNHYPYRHEGEDTDTNMMERINALHHFNFSSRDTNDYLHRNYHDLHKPWDSHRLGRIESIDSCFHHATNTGLNVVSGLKQSPQEIIDHARSLGHEVGDHIHLHLPAYTSTTTRFATAMAFSKTHWDGEIDKGATNHRHIFHIHVPAGNRLVGLEMHPDLENGNEREIVLPRDTIVRVNTTPSVFSMSNNARVHVWHAHVVGTNPVPLKKMNPLNV